MIFDLLEIKDNDLNFFEEKHFFIVLGKKENDFRLFFYKIEEKSIFE